MSRASVERFHPEAAFGGFTDIDSTVMFYARVQQLLSEDAVAVDVGCGRGTQADDPVRLRRELRILRGKCKQVIGIDVDPAAAANPFVDEFRMIESDQRWPLDDRSADLAVADFVLEHVADPDMFFSEAARVLRPGGAICIRTINGWSYLGVASRLVPDLLHARVLRNVQPERATQDVFPTFYRCNSVPRLRRSLDAHGFQPAVYGAEAEPAYLRFNSAAYAVGLAHRRLAPNWLRVGLIAWGRRRTG
jgi:SAM-dependent methyltransferase